MDIDLPIEVVVACDTNRLRLLEFAAIVMSQSDDSSLIRVVKNRYGKSGWMYTISNQELDKLKWMYSHRIVKRVDFETLDFASLNFDNLEDQRVDGFFLNYYDILKLRELKEDMIKL